MSAFELSNPAGLYDPRPNGYSHLAQVNPVSRFVYVAGQGGEDASGALSPHFDEQLRQALDNVATALAGARAQLHDVFKLTVLIVDHDAAKLEQLSAAVRQRWQMAPTCTLIPVPCLALPGMLVEVEAIAAVAA